MSGMLLFVSIVSLCVVYSSFLFFGGGGEGIDGTYSPFEYIV